MHVGLQQFEKRRHGRFRKYRDVINASKRGNQFGAVGGFENRATWPLGGRGRIIIHGNDETVGFQRGRLKIPDVTHMQEVETAVGKCDGSSRASIGGDQLEKLVTGHEFLSHGRSARRSEVRRR